jgi:hypothetical protein
MSGPPKRDGIDARVSSACLVGVRAYDAVLTLGRVEVVADFLGGILIAPDILAVVVGEERSKRIAERLRRLSESLRGEKLREAIGRLILGSFGGAILVTAIADRVRAVGPGLDAFRSPRSG